MQSTTSILKTAGFSIFIVGLFIFGARAATMSYDFNDGVVPDGTMIPTTPTAGTLNPALGVTNAGGFTNSGCLILTRPSSGESFGQWWVTNLLSGDPVASFKATFKLWTGNGTGGSAPVPNAGGNGVIFHVGPQPPTQYTGGASSWGNGLDVTFRVYSSTPTYGLHVFYNPVDASFHPGAGTVVANTPFIGYFDTNGVPEAFSNAVDVVVTMNNGLLSLSCSNALIGNVVVYNNLVIPGFAPLTGISGAPAVFGFTATDGSGAHEAAWVDNVTITAEPASGPVAFTKEPVSQTVSENSYATFDVTLTGAPPYYYQWFSNSVAIPDATNATYRTPLTLYAMDGTAYSVTVSNSINSITSSNAILTVIKDTVGVQPVSVGSVNGSSIGVLFSGFVDPVTAGTPANYSVNGGAVAVTAATVRTNIANYGDPVANYAPSYLKTVRLSLASPVTSGFTVTVKPGVLSRTGLPVTQTTLTGQVAGMADVDLGTAGVDPLAAGEAFSGGTDQIEVVGGGSNILPIGSGTSDAGNFVYSTAAGNGNFDVAAKLMFETLTANNAKAGLMVRPMPTDASSPAIGIKVFPGTPGNNTYETAMRASYGAAGVSWSAIGGNGNAAAYWASTGANWMRIRRVASTYYGYASGDGVTWNLIGQVTPDTFTFPLDTEYVGLYVSAANNDGRLCEADFSNWGPMNFAGAVVAITNDLRATPPYSGYENSHLTLSVGASVNGAPVGELTYQWQRKASGASTFADIIDGTGNASAYTTPLLTVAADNGAQYRVIAFVGDVTAGHSATSAVATLSVQVDTLPPYMSAASADASFQQITINFDGPMDSGSMLDISHYTLVPVGGGTPVGIASASPILNPDWTFTSVVLALNTPLTPGTKYQLTVTDVLDAAGNNINNTTMTGGKSRVVTGWALAYGYLKYERWTGPSYPSGAGPYFSIVETLLNNVNFPNAPTTTQLITYSGYPNGDISNPSVNTFDFGARISGFFVPSTTAAYSWYVRGNDGTALWVSSSSTPPNTSTELHKAAVNTSFSSPGASWIASQTNLGTISVNGNYPDKSAIQMAAGQLYALTAIEQQGNGTSFIEFTCGTDGATVQGGISITNTPAGAYPTAGRGGAPTNTYNLKGNNIAVYVNPDISVITASGPTDVQVEDRKIGTFSVSASAVVSAGGTPTPVGPVLYQWYSNNVLIAGATGSSYTTPQVTYPAPVMTYSVAMSVNGLPFMTTTNSATLTVIPDTTPPFVVAASSYGGNSIGLRFDSFMDPVSTTTAANYTLTGATVTNVVLRPDGITVLLQLDQRLTGSSFTVNIDGVKDAALNPLKTSVSGNLLLPQIVGALDLGVGTNALGAGVLQVNSQPALTNLTFDVNFPGSTVMVTNGVFEILASGLDIGNRQDGQQFVYEQRTGDFDIKVRVDGLTVANALSRAGLMLRENLTPGSRRYSIVADPPSTPAADGSGNGQNKVEVNYRAAQDGTSANWTNNPNPAGLGASATATQIPGIYLRLKLVGNNLYAYTSGDAVNWALAARETLASSWPKTYYVGICATSHQTNALAGTYTAARLSDYGDYTMPSTIQALMFVGNESNVPPGSPNAPQQASDTLVYNQLLGLGYNVTVVHNLTAQPEDAEGKSVIVWSSTGNSGDVGSPLSRFAAVPVPLLTWENAAPQKLNLTSAGGGTAAGQTAINITNSTSPLAMGLSGNVTISSSATYTYATKASLAPGVSVVASQSSDATRTVFFACEQGAALTGANSGPSVAPHRRVVVFMDDNTPAALNATGLKLFTNAIQWAAATGEAPSILTQPASQAVAVGTPAVFLVTAVGPGPYTYQWSKTVGGTTTDIAGATSRDYTILAASLADDGASYSVKVTGINSGLSVTSAGATLSVQTPVAIATQPQDAQPGIGQTATFSVTASGSAPSYQWYVVVPATSTNAITGATGSSYTTPTLAAADSGKQYYVVVANLISSATSALATLTVSSQPVFSGPTVVNGQLILNWTGAGTLQSAPEVTGEWTNVPNGTSPFTNTIVPEVPRLFYRIKVQ